jgi:hypothetical protein
MSNAVIDRDLLCRGCGYNLRGLLPTGSCPECATEISLSLAPSSLSLNQAKDFRLADMGALMIAAVCCWEIVSKTGWILKISHAAPGQALWPINLVCSNPRVMVLISLLQVAGLFAFSALARSQFRVVLLVLGLLLSVMEIPFAIGNRWDKEITVLAEAFIAVIFYPQWLGYAAKMAAAVGDDLLARRFAVLRWITGGTLSLFLIGYLGNTPVMIGGGAVAVIVLSVWMIPLILRLRTALHRITPSDEWSGPVSTPKLPPPDLARRDKHWLWRVHAGLVMEGIFLCVVLVFPVFSFATTRLGTLGMPAIQSLEISRVHSHAAIRAVFFTFLGAAQLVCIWWISSPVQGATGPVAPRNSLRFFAAVSLAASMASPIFSALGAGILTGTFGIQWLAVGAELFFFCRLIEKDLSIRAADEDVRWQAAILKWLLPLAAMQGVPLIAVCALNLGLIDSPGTTAVLHLSRMLSIVFHFWGIWIIYWLSRSFARALATPLNPGDVI